MTNFKSKNEGMYKQVTQNLEDMSQRLQKRQSEKERKTREVEMQPLDSNKITGNKEV